MNRSASSSAAQWVTRGAEAGERLLWATALPPLEEIGTKEYCETLLGGGAVFVPRHGRSVPDSAEDVIRRIDQGLNGQLESRELATAVGGRVCDRLEPNSILQNEGRKKIIKFCNSDVVVSAGYRESHVNLRHTVVSGPKGVGTTSLHVTYAAAVAEATSNVMGLYFSFAAAAIIPRDPLTLVAAAMLVGGEGWLNLGEDEWLRRAIKIFEYPSGEELESLCKELNVTGTTSLASTFSQWLSDKGLGIFFAIDEADLLYHSKMEASTFRRWRSFFANYAESSPAACARGGMLRMSWALTGSGSRLHSFVIRDTPSVDEKSEGDFRSDFPIANSSKVPVCSLSTESSFEEFCEAVRKLTNTSDVDPGGTANLPTTGRSGIVLEKLGRYPLSDAEVAQLLRDRYSASLVYKRSYGNPRTLRGLLEGQREGALQPAPTVVHEAVCCIAEWFLQNQRGKVMSVVADPFSFRCEDFALLAHEILDQNAHRRQVDELMGRPLRVLLEDGIFYELCDTGYMQPCHVPGEIRYVTKFAVSSATVLFIGLSKASILKGISNGEVKLFDGLQVGNLGELLEPTVMRQLVECMERRKAPGKVPPTNLFFHCRVTFSGRDTLTWGNDPRRYAEGTADSGVRSNVILGTNLTETATELAPHSALANETPDQRGADYVFGTLCDPREDDGVYPPRPGVRGEGWTGTHVMDVPDGQPVGTSPRVFEKELWIARFQIRLGKRTRSVGMQEAQRLLTMLNAGGFVRGSGGQSRVGGQRELNNIFLRKLCGDESSLGRVRVRWLWVLVTSRDVTPRAAKHLRTNGVLIWGRMTLWRSLGSHLRIVSALRGWEHIGYDRPGSLSVMEGTLAAAIGVPQGISDAKTARAQRNAERCAKKSDSDD